MVASILHPTTAFAPATLRLSQNFHDTLGVKKLVVTVAVRRPARKEFIRVHADPALRLDTAILNLKEQREIYLAALASEITPMVLVTVVNRQKMGSLWPIRLPGADGRLDAWNTSALQAAERAQAHWVRVMANMSLGAYDSAAPYNTGPDSLVVVYYASPEMGCYLALGWALPEVGRDAKARAL